jgi:hypothetical protein
VRREDLYWAATLAAENVVAEHGITALPVRPIALARQLGIEVMAKPARASGVSGMLLRVGNSFGIAYATHIDNLGFQHFSIGHELGHYLLPGHIDAVLGDGDVHESRAGFASGDRYEMEADHFAAALLMPRALFTDAMGPAGEGLAAIERLAGLCETSLTATAIRYTQYTGDPVAIVLSTGQEIDYCFMSDALKEVDGLNWIRKHDRVPKSTPTSIFNRDEARVRRAERVEDTCDLQDWFGGRLSARITEEVIGLGKYGKTLTILTAPELPDPEEIQEEEELIESWKPRFRR